MGPVMASIYSKFAPVGVKPTFYTNMGGRLRPFTARQGETFPYCVFSLIGDSNDVWLDGETQESITMQFSILANESSMANINTYFTNLKALYDECVLTVTGYTFLRMERTWAYPMRDDPNNVWQYVVQYNILIET